jgi:biopolymer transport protein ExbD
MAGVNVESGGRGGRRTVDSEINMIPMIDLLMVTISFLLITAVWTHMSRIDASAQVPGQSVEPLTPRPPEKQLHVEMRSPDKFTLSWKQGGTVIGDSIEIPRKAPELPVHEGRVEAYRYPELAARIATEWKNAGSHRGDDKALDQAVLHTDNETPYGKLIAVMDAIYEAKRPSPYTKKGEPIPAFNVTFSVN